MASLDHFFPNFHYFYGIGVSHTRYMQLCVCLLVLSSQTSKLAKIAQNTSDLGLKWMISTMYGQFRTKLHLICYFEPL